MLLPQKPIFIELTREQYKKMTQKKAQGQGVEIRDSKLEELIVDGDGGLIAGQQTRYFKLRISVTASEGGEAEEIIAGEEFWTAPSLPNSAPALDMLTEQISGIEQLDTLLQYKKLRGYPLKRIVQISENGQIIGNSLVEITKILQVPVADAVFEVPQGYQKLDVSGKLQ